MKILLNDRDFCDFFRALSLDCLDIYSAVDMLARRYVNNALRADTKESIYNPSVQEVADYYGVSRRAVGYWKKDGVFKEKVAGMKFAIYLADESISDIGENNRVIIEDCLLKGLILSYVAQYRQGSKRQIADKVKPQEENIPAPAIKQLIKEDYIPQKVMKFVDENFGLLSSDDMEREGVKLGFQSDDIMKAFDKLREEQGQKLLAGSSFTAGPPPVNIASTGDFGALLKGSP